MDKETVRDKMLRTITEELIERLPADKLCRKYIDGELASDMESEVFDSIMCAVELHARSSTEVSTNTTTIQEANVRKKPRTPLSSSEQTGSLMS